MAPETEAREALINLIKTEFAPEGFPVMDDRLHGSLGADGPIAGCFPVRTIANREQKFVNEMFIMVQIFGHYDKIVDPKQTVSPKRIEEWAERFRKSLNGADLETENVWYFELDQIVWKPDPTGNITRFEASIIARGNNTALI